MGHAALLSEIPGLLHLEAKVAAIRDIPFYLGSLPSVGRP
jgi:hypothetical protein